LVLPVFLFLNPLSLRIHYWNLKKVFELYKKAFGGLSRPAWMLAVVMLINRSGTMVVPFLSIYLTSSLGFSIDKAGIILTCFGIGSMTGAFLGGSLSDRYGHFIVQVTSLIGGGIIFILLSGITEYYKLLAGILILSVVSESLRPANSSSVASYARPENVARAFSLNRMAINLGFSIGPAVGGLLAAISYRWLFVADGVTCILAGLFFYFYFSGRKSNPRQMKPGSASKTGYSEVFRNLRFMSFVFLVSCFAILFFQLFMTLPLFYRDAYHLSEGSIGMLLAMNGIVVFSLEMVMVFVLNRRFRIHELIFPGMILLGMSFVILNIFQGSFILVISMFILSLAEILTLPFMATFTVQQSGEHNRGAYMGLYTISFSFAQIIAPFLGSRVIIHYGYETLWWGTGIFAVIIGIGLYYVTNPRNYQLKSV
jgi:predicted MFS family arabinose efflux permease